jgi:hypothetical protein
MGIIILWAGSAEAVRVQAPVVQAPVVQAPVSGRPGGPASITGQVVQAASLNEYLLMSEVGRAGKV